MSTRNDINDAQRIDDVTIEKVNISKEQLDKSLFDYEQHKNTKKSYGIPNKVKNNTMSNTEKDSKSMKGVNYSVSLVEIEKDLEDFLINPTQNMYAELSMIKRSKLTLTLEDVVKKKSDLEKSFSEKLEIKSIKVDANVKSEPTTKKFAQFYNLKEIYKWQPVNKTPAKNQPPTISSFEISKKTTPAAKEQINKIIASQKTYEAKLNRFHRKNYAYSYYYSHYYNYYLNVLISKTAE